MTHEEREKGGNWKTACLACYLRRPTFHLTFDEDGRTDKMSSKKVASREMDREPFISDV